MDQQIAVTTKEGRTTRRRPLESSSLPRQGPLTAMHNVAAALTSPAAP